MKLIEGYDVLSVIDIMSRFPDVVDIQVFGCKLLTLATDGTSTIRFDKITIVSQNNIRQNNSLMIIKHRQLVVCLIYMYISSSLYTPILNFFNFSDVN